MNIGSKLFYTAEDYALLTIVDTVSNPTSLKVDTDIIMNSYLHPNGIKQLFLPREFRLAHAIAQILSGLSHNSKEGRLQALQSLQEESLYAVPLVCNDLRYNTARVLVKSMKELIKAQGNIRKQLHLAHAFQRAARGNLYIVRRLLQEYHLLEMPEAYNQLSFDHYVHDMYSKGTNSPSQVLLDAWIQGIKDIHIIYYNYALEDAVDELFEAGQILDISTNFGIEYHIPLYDTFAEIVWSPLPHIQRRSFIKSFFAQEDIQEIMNEGKIHSDAIAMFTLSLISRYNTTEHTVLAEQYDIATEEINIEDYLAFVNQGQSSPQRLADYIYQTLIENKNNTAKSISLLHIHSFINDMVQSSEDSPFNITQYSTPESIHQLMTRLYSLSPASHICLHMSNLTASEVLTLIWASKGSISHIELFNLKEWLYNQQSEADMISKIQYAINTKDIQEMKKLVRTMIQECSISDISYKEERLETLRTIFNDIPKILYNYADTSLDVRIGSHSSGTLCRDYSMGFIFEETIPTIFKFTNKTNFFRRLPIFAKLQKNYTYTPHYGITSFWNTSYGKTLHSIPYIQSYAKEKSITWNVENNLYEIVAEHQGCIIGAGKTTLEETTEIRKYPNISTDINNKLVYYAQFFIAFAISFLTFYLSQENIFLKYFGGFAWLGITLLRLVLQTMYAVGFGYKFIQYTTDNLILPRIADIVFITGTSVFIIEYLVRYLILKRGFNIDITSHPILVFSIIGTTSIIIIMLTGWLRGLPRQMVLANASRIILALPISLFYTWVFIHILEYFNIVNIDIILESSATLLAKCASETVVGILLGSVLRAAFIKARIWDYTKTINSLLQSITTLEEIHSDKEITFLLQQPSIFLSIIKEENHNIFTSLYINLLDLFYFWYYLPLSRTALRTMVKNYNPTTKKILDSLFILLEHTENVESLFNIKQEYQQYNKFILFYKKEYQAFITEMKELLSP